MDTSDDPVTIGLLVGTGIGGTFLAKEMAGDVKAPSIEPARIPETDPALLDPQKREKRRQKLAASVMTKDWDEAILGKPGLLGVS